MVVQDIVSIGAPLAAVAVVGAGFVWQMMRRRTKKPPMPSVAHRDKATEQPTPKTAQDNAETKSQAVLDFEAMGPGRPRMLAVTAMRGDATVAEVFIQTGNIGGRSTSVFMRPGGWTASLPTSINSPGFREVPLNAIFMRCRFRRFWKRL